MHFDWLILGNFEFSLRMTMAKDGISIIINIKGCKWHCLPSIFNFQKSNSKIPKLLRLILSTWENHSIRSRPWSVRGNPFCRAFRREASSMKMSHIGRFGPHIALKLIQTPLLKAFWFHLFMRGPLPNPMRLSHMCVYVPKRWWTNSFSSSKICRFCPIYVHAEVNLI